ncbi:hypothetical protein [Cyanobium sp. CH-040]|uniref:hypothetical protein n=1 Tax=Cyanobium sp. CH-040 TaxID=2823708 RepID=UPI0020CCA8BF|nr:hypothetical protein [Cyanobium sp. CH-040]MCP9928827.1 hypothetical protein [Cyanobium sp. CH-040]
MSTFGKASGSIWENWMRDHGQWITESRDPLEAIGKVLWTPFGAASTGVAAYVDEFERHPEGTLVKTGGVALSTVIPGAGAVAVAADAAAIAGGHVLGGEINRQQEGEAADRRVQEQTRASVNSNAAGRDELHDLYS